MSRLIDADAFAENLIYCKGLGRKSYEAVLDALKEQPAAFNVDKVIHKIHCHFIDRIDDAEQEEIEKLKHDNKVICGIIRNSEDTEEQGLLVKIDCHCKDCVHWSDMVAGATEHVKLCTIGGYMVGHNGYCVYGEKKLKN